MTKTAESKIHGAADALTRSGVGVFPDAGARRSPRERQDSRPGRRRSGSPDSNEPLQWRWPA
jgi:hypothetical protein